MKLLLLALTAGLMAYLILSVPASANCTPTGTATSCQFVSGQPAYAPPASAPENSDANASASEGDDTDGSCNVAGAAAFCTLADGSHVQFTKVYTTVTNGQCNASGAFLFCMQDGALKKFQREGRSGSSTAQSYATPTYQTSGPNVTIIAPPPPGPVIVYGQPANPYGYYYPPRSSLYIYARVKL